VEHGPVSSQFTRGTDILTVFEGEYVLVSMPSGTSVRLPEGGELTVVVHDPVEITVILEVQRWAQIEAEHPDANAQRGYKAIRLSQDFPLETVGVMAKLTGALARAGVSIMAYSTYKSDVVLVRQWELTRALGVLWDLRF
jgi:hypothetical protein